MTTTAIKKERRKHNKKVRKSIKAAFIGIDRHWLAFELESSPRTIDQIANGLLVVSPERAKDIERITKGEVKASILRPDIFDICTK